MDAEASTTFSEDVKGTETFTYDANGNLLTRLRGGGTIRDVLEWNAYGKVQTVQRWGTDSRTGEWVWTWMHFTYDAQQNRLSKEVHSHRTGYKVTYYIRDAQGNVLAVYERTKKDE